MQSPAPRRLLSSVLHSGDFFAAMLPQTALQRPIPAGMTSARRLPGCNARRPRQVRYDRLYRFYTIRAIR